jgi:ribose transport system substrate-binding protein
VLDFDSAAGAEPQSSTPESPVKWEERKMKLSRRGLISVVSALATMTMGFAAPAGAADKKEIVYLTPSLNLPFWRYLSNGIESVAKKEGFSYTALDSNNSAETQLKNAQDAIARGVAGIAISPTDSSTAPSVLAAAARAKIPVVVADIGTNSGDYVSFIISDNKQGAFGVGEALAAALKEKGWTDGSVGLVTISQARKNGQARTAGFREAMKNAGITKEAGLQQMQAYTADETFKFTQDMLTANPNMKAMFIQTDQPTMGALRAIKAGHRDGTLLVAAFDGIPEFVDLLKKGDIVASGMQQPYLMGVKSGEALISAIKGGTPEKQILVPIIVATSKNIDEILPTIKQTVFGNELK